VWRHSDFARGERRVCHDGNPQGIAMAMARPMHRLSVIAGPLVRFLSTSVEALLRILGIKSAKDRTVTEEEIKLLVREELHAGVFQRVETEMVESVLMLDTLPVRNIMTPRPKIIWLNRDDSHETVWHKIVLSHHTNFPVYEANRDNVVGIVSMKAFGDPVLPHSSTGNHVNECL
jgi:putative hemolysin